MSLLECNSERSDIFQRVRRFIPTSVLKNNIVHTYNLFKKYHNKNYNEKCFKLYETPIDEKKDQEEYEFIIEL